MANVFAYAEARGGGEVHALVAGPAGTAAGAAALGEYGADVVHVVEHEALANYNAEATAAAAAERVRAGGYRAAVFSASVQGRDLAPRVAARLGAGLAADVISFEAQG